MSKLIEVILEFRFFCCNTKPNRLFKHEFIKPVYKFLAFYECPVCGKKWFEEINEKTETPKLYFDEAAIKKLEQWQRRIEHNIFGTQAKEYFYFGTYHRTPRGYKTYRTNFNNQKEFLFEQKTKIINTI